MSNTKYSELASAIKGKTSNREVVINEDQSSVRLYPSARHSQDYAIEVYCSGNSAELWQAGFRIKKFRSIRKPFAVADAILMELMKTEAMLNE